MEVRVIFLIDSYISGFILQKPRWVNGTACPIGCCCLSSGN